MPKNDAGWNLARIKTGSELSAHEVFVRDKVLRREGIDLYTPFIERRQRPTRKMKASRQRAFTYAEAALQGWLIFRPHTPVALARVMQLMDDKPYLYAVQLSGPQPYSIHPRMINVMINGEPLRDADGIYIEGRWKGLGRSYDPKRDSKKNRKKIYAQGTQALPELSPGEVTRMLEGPWTGIDMKVEQVREEWATVSFKLFGAERTIEAPRIDLTRAG